MSDATQRGLTDAPIQLAMLRRPLRPPNLRAPASADRWISVDWLRPVLACGTTLSR